jgi:hypothetical protein
MARLYGIRDVTVLVPVSNRAASAALAVDSAATAAATAAPAGVRAGIRAGVRAGTGAVWAPLGDASRAALTACLTVSERGQENQATQPKSAQRGDGGGGKTAAGGGLEEEGNAEDYEGGEDADQRRGNARSEEEEEEEAEEKEGDPLHGACGASEAAAVALTPSGQVQWLLHRKRTARRQRALQAEDATARGLALSPTPFRGRADAASHSAGASTEASAGGGAAHGRQPGPCPAWAVARPLGWALQAAGGGRSTQGLTADDVKQLAWGWEATLSLTLAPKSVDPPSP